MSFYESNGIFAPVPSEPIGQALPSQSYSERARLKFKRWQESLTAAPATSGR